MVTLALFSRELLHGEKSPNSKTRVAIKAINDPSNKDDLTAFISEIKILSNLHQHLNLVNMVACCTSDYGEASNIWVMLEFLIMVI